MVPGCPGQQQVTLVAYQRLWVSGQRHRGERGGVGVGQVEVDTCAGSVGQGGGGGGRRTGGEWSRRHRVLMTKRGGMCYVGAALLVGACRESRIRLGLLGTSMEVRRTWELLWICQPSCSEIGRTERAGRMGWGCLEIWI